MADVARAAGVGVGVVYRHCTARRFRRGAIESGRADGTVRPDATVADIYMIVGAVAAISRDGFGDWRRFIELTLDGLRRPH